MTLQKLQGLVIKIWDFQEQDQIIHLLTNEQVVVFVALGTRKMSSKNRFALQIGNVVDVEIFKNRFHNRMSKLKKAEIVIQPQIYISDVAKVILTIINEINKINLYGVNDMSNILQLIKNGWKHLGFEFNHHVKTYIIFHLLSNYGLKMQLNCCVACARTSRINGFEFYQGGFSCVFHTKKKRNLQFLQAINFLDKSLENYLQIPAEINQIIYWELNNYLRDFASY